ncbi:MAG: hypothetical protein H5T41_09405 [Methanomassiliicoccales archaeon]|nr:hypothetical protein [Methanomassiliicoccales archaeon]
MVKMEIMSWGITSLSFVILPEILESIIDSLNVISNTSKLIISKYDENVYKTIITIQASLKHTLRTLKISPEILYFQSSKDTQEITKIAFIILLSVTVSLLKNKELQKAKYKVEALTYDKYKKVYTQLFE